MPGSIAGLCLRAGRAAGWLLMTRLLLLCLLAAAVHLASPLSASFGAVAAAAAAAAAAEATRDLSDRAMSTHGLLGCEDAPYVARRFLQHDRGGDGGASPARALAHLRRVIVDDPTCAKARFELGRVLQSAAVGDVSGAHLQFEETFVSMRDQLQMAIDGGGADGGSGGIDWYAMPLELQQMLPFTKSSRAKMQHDAQQLAQLLQEGKVAREASQQEVRLLRETAEMYWEMGTFMPETGAVTIPDDMLPTLPFLGLMLHRETGLRYAPGESVVKPGVLDTGGVLANFQANGVAVVNNALQPAPMARLYRWLTESTIWHYVDERGYISAHFTHGLSTPLLVQLIEEVSTQLSSRVFSNKTRLVFKEAWANRYDSSPYSQGVAPTVEDADLKVVIWLTPRVKNMDQRSGGLRVWNEAAPVSWFRDPGRIPGQRTGTRPPFEQFRNGRQAGASNVTRARVAAWVESPTRKKPISISYRTNALVLFNPRLAHATDKFYFEPGFQNLRTSLALTFDFEDTAAADKVPTRPIPLVPQPQAARGHGEL